MIPSTASLSPVTRWRLGLLLASALAAWAWGGIDPSRPEYRGYDLSYYRSMARAAPGLAVPPVPLAWRPFGPWLAGVLPLPEPLAFTALAVAAYLAVVVAFHGLLCAGGIRARAAAVAAFLFALNANLLGYAVWNPYQLGDSLGMLLLVAGLWSMRTGRWWAFAVAGVLGAVTRETALLCVPAAVVQVATAGTACDRKRAATAIGVVLATVALARWFLPHRGGRDLWEAFREYAPLWLDPPVLAARFVYAWVPLAMLPLVRWASFHRFVRARADLVAVAALAYGSAAFGGDIVRLLAPAAIAFYAFAARVLDEEMDERPAALAVVVAACLATSLDHRVARFPLPDARWTLGIALVATVAVTGVFLVGRQRARGRLALRLALAVTGAALGLALGEAGMRLAGVDPTTVNNPWGWQWRIPPDAPAADNPFGFPPGMRATRPGTRTTMNGHAVRIDAFGMRSDRDRTLARPPGVEYRAMLVGDSVLFSSTANEDGVATATERALGSGAEVLPMACPAWGLDEYATAFDLASSRFDLDAIAVLLVMNDLPQGPVPVGDRSPRADSAKPIEHFEIARRVAARSALATAALRVAKPMFARAGLLADPSLPLLVESDSDLRRRMEWMRPVLDHFRAASSERGVRLAIAIAPYLVQLDAEAGERVLERWYGQAWNPAFLERRPQRAILDLCRSVGVTCVDLAPIFLRAAPVEDLFATYRRGEIDYVHPNEAGNRAIAEGIARALGK